MTTPQKIVPGGLPSPRMRKLHELKPAARNARTHSRKQVRQIADSIRAFGFTNPVLVDQDSQVIAGHGRLAAAQLLRRPVESAQAALVGPPRDGDARRRHFRHSPRSRGRRPRFGCFCGTFNPSRRQIRSTRLRFTAHPALRSSAVTRR